MKKLLALLFASTSLVAFGTPLLYDGFNYSLSPTNLAGQVNPGGPTWEWAAPTTSAATNNQPAIVSGSLNYSGLAPSVGNSVLFGGNGASSRLSWGSSQISTGAVYYSLILKITDITALNTTTPQFFVAATPSVGSGTPTIVVAGLNALKVDATHYVLGIKKAGGGILSSSVTNTVGDVVFVVCSYKFVTGPGTGTGDEARLWINPSSATFGAATAPPETLLSTGSADLAASSTIGAVTIFNRSTSQPNAMILDELTAGTTWADVTPDPTVVAFTSQPKNQRTVLGGHATFAATTFRATTNQWQHNGVDIAGAQSATLSLTNVQSSDAGTYHLIIGNGVASKTSSDVTLTVYPDIYPRLVPLWSLAPSSRPYLTADGSTTPNERSFAYNALSNQVLLVSRTNTAFNYITNAAIFVLNGDTGADLYQMNADPTIITGGFDVTGGGTNLITLNCIDVADDGAVYAANVGNASSGTAEFMLYRWDNSGPSAAPVNLYSGDAGGQSPALRWGDSLAVRGSDTNTQILLVNSTGVAGSVLSPNPGHPVTDFWAYSYFTNMATGSTGGRTLLFSGTNSQFWEKHGGGGGSGGGLVLMNYGTGTSSILTNYPNLPSTPNLLAFTAATNVLFSIAYAANGSTVPDTLEQYDYSDPTQPLFVTSYNFPANHQPNANGCGRVIVSGDRVYALDANNGMAAYRLEPVLSITPAGANVVLAWPASTPGYTLKASPSLNPPAWTNVSTGTLVGQQYFATNAASANALFYRLQK